MSKEHLVLVVHGIGEQKPGDTISETVGQVTCKGEHHVSGTRRLIAEKQRAEYTRKTGLFESNSYDLVRISDKQKTTLAEVYWADLSPSPKGLAHTLYDLLSNVFGFGYLANENLDSIVPEKSSWLRKCARLFPLALCGPVAAINVMLIFGILVHLILSFIFGKSIEGWAENDWLVSLQGAILFCAGIALMVRAKTHYGDIFASWVMYAGIAMAIVPWIVSMESAQITNLACPDLISGHRGYMRQMECLVSSLLFFQNFVFAGLILLITFTTLAAFGVVEKEDREKILFPSIHIFTLLIWLVSLSAIWQAVANVLPEGTGSFYLQKIIGEYIGGAQYFTTYALFALGIFSIVAIFVAGNFMATRKSHEKKILAGSESPRLIVHGALRHTLHLMLILLLLALARYFNPTFDMPGQIDNAVINALDAASAYVAPILLIIAGGFAYLLKTVSVVLGTVRDTIVFSARSAAGIEKPMRSDGGTYAYRERIKDRLLAVMESFLKTGRYNKVSVLSHSQGTVISSLVLASDDIKELLEKHKIKGVDLVTMGSPLSHLYGTYFSSDISNMGSIQDNLNRWANIYRTDDPIGTRIAYVGLGEKMSQHAVHIGGHSHYWTDNEVWDKIQNEAKLLQI